MSAAEERVVVVVVEVAVVAMIWTSTDGVVASLSRGAAENRTDAAPSDNVLDLFFFFVFFEKFERKTLLESLDVQ